MKAQWDNPVSYARFTARLKKMSLCEAIERPRVEYQVRDQSSKTPIQDNIRRSQTLKSERVNILDLDDLIKIESESPRITIEDIRKVKERRTMIPKPKQSIWRRFIRLFK